MPQLLLQRRFIPFLNPFSLSSAAFRSSLSHSFRIIFIYFSLFFFFFASVPRLRIQSAARPAHARCASSLRAEPRPPSRVAAARAPPGPRRRPWPRAGRPQRRLLPRWGPGSPRGGCSVPAEGMAAPPAAAAAAASARGRRQRVPIAMHSPAGFIAEGREGGRKRVLRSLFVPMNSPPPSPCAEIVGGGTRERPLLLPPAGPCGGGEREGGSRRKRRGSGRAPRLRGR